MLLAEVDPALHDVHWTMVWTAWTGIATAVLALAAIVGGFFARNELREAIRARTQATADAYDLQQRADRRAAELHQEQIAPYVVILMDPSTVGNGVMDLVCRNFGQTVALDVQVTFDTPLQRTRPGATTPSNVRWPALIPSLAPGQEFRVLWDLASNYFGSDLPKPHTARISYSDTHGGQHYSNAVLDWEIFRGMLNVTVKGAHHAADALEKISKTVGDFSEGFAEKGVRVYVRDGDAKDRDEEVRMRAVVEEMRAAQQADSGYVEEALDPNPS